MGPAHHPIMTRMRTLLLTTAFLATVGIAQEPTRSSAVTERAAPADAAQWIKKLGSGRYRDRQEAERKLQSMGVKAKAALEAAAADEGDVEVQWRAKRLLQQLKKSAPAGGAESSGLRKRKSGLVERGARGQKSKELRQDIDPRVDLPGEDVEKMRDEIDRMLDRVKKDFGMDLPKHPIFGGELFRGLRVPLTTTSESQGMSVQVGPDGVHVEVTEDGQDGKSETKVYDAPDMETFQRNYPGVLPKNGTGLGLSPFGGKDLTEGLDALRGMVGTLPGGIDWRLLKPQVIPFDHGRVLLPRSGVGAPQGGRVAPVPRSGERLGIVIKEMPEVLRTYLELSPGAGLMVDSVQSDTLAEALGLKANDIVMSINDRRIHSPASVQKALADIPKGDVVTVKIVRRGERRERTATKLRDAKSSRQPLKPVERKSGK
jgi:hypothetical protein